MPKLKLKVYLIKINRGGQPSCGVKIATLF